MSTFYATVKLPSKLMPLWKVLLHNDDVSSAGFVVEAIQEITKLDEADAIEKMLEADEEGISLLKTVHRELAELYFEQFQSKKLTVTIEPDK